METQKNLPHKIMHPDLQALENLYQSCGLHFQNLQSENESVDYGAAEFILDNRFVKFRVGKITPTKIGQFVTFWKRTGQGPISPYEALDPINFLIVSVRTPHHFGHFIFPKSILCAKGIITSNGIEGKRAMRIYPAWDKAENSQAKKTQAWQLHYFIDYSDEANIDCALIQSIFKII